MTITAPAAKVQHLQTSSPPEGFQTGSPGQKGSPLEVLLVFLKLGVTCFGGPIANLGYFRDEFVVRRKWIDEHAYADVDGLCQFLPGPASSQVAFSVGLMRAGYGGPSRPGPVSPCRPPSS